MKADISIIFLGLLTMTSIPARAFEVNFDNNTGPGDFASAGAAQTLAYNFSDGLTATFNGGVVLTGETNQSTDNSSVYATSSFGDPTLTNPLSVTFSKGIQNFQIDILNAFSGNYELYDNAGHMKFFSLATNGGSVDTEGFGATGTQVFVKYLDSSEQDFAIDNVTFDQPLSMSTVPLPASAPMFGAALLAFGAVGYGTRRKAKAA